MDNTSELGSGMGTPGTPGMFMPAVVPNENVTAVTFVAAVIPLR
jgi:hypothetical protein